MKFKSKFLMLMISFATAFFISACSGDQAENAGKESSGDHSSHANMEHSGSGEIPEGLKNEENPAYKVGSKAVIIEDHMPGMDGAEATIVGAYDTVVYSLSYDPTNGGLRVENHKWVIHEELKDAGDQPLKAGDEAIINTDHMEGMKGAKAVIDTAEQTTVYMVDFTPTDGSEKVTNHQWVTESELSSAK
ncbi:YdhK family protein [Heyndrickxia sp. MSNUG]|uniref:YdhK family protein n=1 Tax=Heyndrickxia sp. MSNUG TaxID=3136677 RepID=UPI003C309A3A